MLSPKQRALLAERRRGAAGASRGEPEIARRAQRDEAPLSFAQQRLWFLWKLDPTGCAYHLSGGLELAGNLDVAALTASIQALLARHEVLRTVFIETPEGSVRQVVRAAYEIELPVIDMTSLDAEARMQREIEQLRSRPFDLATGPLVRVALLKAAPRLHRLIVVMHHIVSDAHSTQIILDELSRLYRARVLGHDPRLSPLPIQYIDYAVWQRQWIGGSEGQRQLRWWREQLADGGARILRADRMRGRAFSYAAARHSIVLDRDLVQGLKRRAHARGSTLFVLLLAGFQALLQRYSGQSDIRIGVPFANRHRAEAAGLVGFFVNTLVVHARVDERSSLEDLLERTRAHAIALQGNQDLPFDRLVEVLEPERAPGAMPLVDIFFNHLRRDRTELSGWPGLTVRYFDIEEATAQVELSLQTHEDGEGGLGAIFEYAAELFEPSTIERLANSYLAMLRALSERPEMSVAEVELLSPTDLIDLRRWGAGAPRTVDARPVHTLIERQCRLAPEAPAVLFGDEALSYGQLNRNANRLARRLIALGIGPECRVGVALERSLDLAVGLLAVLKAGGVYVPLDLEYPAERVGYMIEHGGIELLLTQRPARARLPAIDAVRVFEIDAPGACGGPEDDPRIELHDNALAYVIYTSGSTGLPKAIAVEHVALSHHVQAIAALYGLHADDRLLQFASVSFDAALEQWIVPLACGATIVVRAEGDIVMSRMERIVREGGVTALYLPPSYLRQLLDHLEGRTLEIRTCIVGGEAFPRDECRKAFETLLAQQVINAYGPAETVITPTAWRGTDGDALESVYVPLGVPVGERRALVLDAQMNLVPPGVPGELYLGGIALARGYLARPGATAERFIADPFSDRGERLYRTGDLVRWSARGTLEYLGRLDQQVKIRGFRIEPAEIEAQLRAQPEVREAVVIAHDDTRLAAYVVPAGRELRAQHLRERLSRTLPGYMVPSFIVELDVLPLNANGKLDRSALPRPTRSEIPEDEAPRGPTERRLAALWVDLLGVDDVGRRDSFFALGGHSLAAVRLLARIRTAMGVEVSLRDFFECPSLEQLAAHIDARPRITEMPPLVRTERAANMPLSPTQQRLWLVERLKGGEGRDEGGEYNMAAALWLKGDLNVTALRASLNDIVARHEVLRTVYPQNADGDAVAIIFPPIAIDIPVHDLSQHPPSERAPYVERALESAGARPFDLSAGPLLRVELIRLDLRQHALLLCVHHIAFDGWSEAVFARELVELYRAHSTSGASSLSSLPVQYADYAVWQRALLDASAKQDADFWRRYLEGAPSISTLPPDYERPLLPSTVGAAVTVRIAQRTAEELQRLARLHAASLFTVLFAAFTALLHRLAAADDLVVGTDVAGRNHPDLETLIGFFVNVVPLRTRWKRGATFREWLERSAEASLAALERQHVPFDQIIEHGSVKRDRRFNPLVQVLFVMQNLPRSHFEIPGLAVEIYRHSAVTAKFDLAVFVSESSDGWVAEWTHATSLYRRETIERGAAAWCVLLDRVAESANAPLDELLCFGSERYMAMSSSSVRPQGKLEKLRRIAGRGASAALPTQPVRRSLLAPERPFPLVIEAGSADVDAAAWAAGERESIEAALRKHAGILFRNFGLETPQQFEAFAEAIEPQLYGTYGDLPKKEGGRNIYRSTPYPERQMILYHNESSHLGSWPRKQFFFCELPARSGGATPIVDCREMLRKLPEQLVDELERKGLLYVRTFLPHLDVSWRDFYKTDSRAEVEALLTRDGIEWRWLDAETLSTRTRCPAVIAHPRTGERAFFNQVQLHHVSCLDPQVRADMLSTLGPERMPRQVFFGDGSPISEHAMQVIGRAYEDCAVRFDWRRGDVIMLDNMLAAHARDPYVEPRRIVVAMGEMFSRADLAACPPARVP